MITAASLYSDFSAFSEYFMDKYNMPGDEALRAGVVVNYLDIEGLYNFLPTYLTDGSSARTFNGSMGSAGAATALMIRPYPNILNPMPGKTGGVIIKNSNFF